MNYVIAETTNAEGEPEIGIGLDKWIINKILYWPHNKNHRIALGKQADPDSSWTLYEKYTLLAENIPTLNDAIAKQKYFEEFNNSLCELQENQQKNFKRLHPVPHTSTLPNLNYFFDNNDSPSLAPVLPSDISPPPQLLTRAISSQDNEIRLSSLKSQQSDSGRMFRPRLTALIAPGVSRPSVLPTPPTSSQDTEHRPLSFESNYDEISSQGDGNRPSTFELIREEIAISSQDNEIRPQSFESVRDVSAPISSQDNENALSSFQSIRDEGTSSSSNSAVSSIPLSSIPISTTTTSTSVSTTDTPITVMNLVASNDVEEMKAEIRALKVNAMHEIIITMDETIKTLLQTNQNLIAALGTNVKKQESKISIDPAFVKPTKISTILDFEKFNEDLMDERYMEQMVCVCFLVFPSVL